MLSPSESLLTAEYMGRPVALYKHLHRLGPIYYDANHEFWIASEFDLVSGLLRHPDMSSNREGMSSRRFEGAENRRVRAAMEALGRSMLMMDPPEHTRLRKMANPLMGRERVESWSADINDVFLKLMTPCKEKGEFDLVHDVCELYPTEVIFKLFAVPEALRPKYRECVWRSMKYFGFNLSELSMPMAMGSVAASTQTRGFLTELLEKRCEYPSDDLLSELAAYVVSGETEVDEMTRMASLIVNAGHITTIDLLANGVYQLLSHPDQWRLLKENPELAGQAVEEILRYDSSVPFTFRRATNDIDVPGGTIRKGDFIALGLAAANHDPAINEDPDVFDITRPKVRHVSFGQGVHACLGANLARLEMKTALAALVQHMPDLRFAEHPEPYMKSDTLVFKGFHALPLVC
ncbi:cytochrome P450 [Parendozoicomonas sp. Alg238-R29]|uniref:cytochrome P450 n=1 Tax=Parendozoicomonas sp. Alg238-R29 TaxID=2993446 RepID=UPI00248F3FA1|nr:cytochrome P450 [Parendozoicomonas sp. Alg238-R29]